MASILKRKIFHIKIQNLSFLEISEYHTQLAHMAMTTSIWAGAILVKQGFCSPICPFPSSLLHWLCYSWSQPLVQQEIAKLGFESLSSKPTLLPRTWLMPGTKKALHNTLFEEWTNSYHHLLLEGLSFCLYPGRSCPISRGLAEIQPSPWSLPWFQTTHSKDVMFPEAMGWRTWGQQKWGAGEYWGEHWDD